MIEVVEHNPMPTEYKVVDERDRLIDVYDIEEDALDHAETVPEYKVKVRQYSAETNEDTATNMNYDFIASDDDAQDDNNDFDTVGSMWTLGDHSAIESENRRALIESISDTTDQLDDDVDGDVKAVLQDAADLVKGTSVSRFECPVCGLGHSHPDHKHDIRSSFEVTDAFADNMEFCPYCHCGVNELAMLVDFFPYVDIPVFEDQGDFEGVYEVEPAVLRDMIRAVVSGEKSASQATLMDANSRKQSVRNDVKTFLRRAMSIKRAADAAPIPQESRKTIKENREALEGVLA